MTTGTITTKDTRIYFANPTSSDAEILRVLCATGINGLGGPADQIDITCLDSDEREFVAGMANPGAVTVPINVIRDSAAHHALEELQASGETVSFMIVASDQPGDPTLSDGRLVSPGPTSVEFLGYVSDFNIDIGINEIWRGTVTIQRSGARNFDWPAAAQ